MGRGLAGKTPAAEEPALGRLDGVADYLTYIVERGLLSGATARAALWAAEILREALREEARNADAELD